MKKKSAFILCCVMLLSLLTACGDSSSAPSSQPPQQPSGPAAVQYTQGFKTSNNAIDDYKTTVCDQQGTIKALEYETLAYAYDESVTLTKTAYIYLPYGYDEAQNYNILYLMHGGGENETYWLVDERFGQTTCNVLDNMIKNGICDPVIVVTPTFNEEGFEGEGEHNAELCVVFGKELRNNLIPAVESQYSTYANGDTSIENLISTRDHRAFAGFSMQFIGPILANDNIFGDYNQSWFAAMTPIGIVVSVALTILAIIGIWEKDQPKYFGIGGGKQEQVKVSEYIQIVKANKPLQRLMIAGGGCKLALSIATNVTVLIMLYSCMMGNYDSLYLPMMVLGYVFAVPFFLLTVRTSQKKGQKASLTRYVGVAFLCYIGVLVLLLLWSPDNPNLKMSLMDENGLAINIYTILFILFFGVGYGAYYATADMPIPMVADCADYESYRSGKFIPGIMGTLFSLVDKLVSSLSATVVGIAVTIIGLEKLPTKETPYTPGMNVVVIVLFCVIPMVAWAATLIAMRGYSLSGERVKEIQQTNALRSAAVAEGMTIQQAMEKYPCTPD